MKGDFSRFDFGHERSFSRVLIQQGRMTVDADANEQQDINIRALRGLAADLIGRHGGAGDAFQLTAIQQGGRTHLMIAPGRYYVDGWAAANDRVCAYIDVPGEGDARVMGQPFRPAVPDPSQGSYLAYLELWERSLVAAEVDTLGRPNAPQTLREVALGGPDTAARGQLVWQVKLHPDADLPHDAAGDLDLSDLTSVFDTILPPPRGALKAEAARPPVESDYPCDVPPRSRYRGIENQLYRIEIARGGVAAAQGGATFVWSRENGAVAFPIDHIAGEKVKLADGWRDDRFAVGVTDVVEIVTDASGLGEQASFFIVDDYDPDSMTLTLNAPPDAQSGGARRPLLLRRWDHGRKRTRGDGSPRLTADNTLLIEEDQPLTIEDGITIQFAPGATNNPNVYRAGDYWLIPARTALGDIIWPSGDDGPLTIPPHGIERHMAPLGLVEVGPGNTPAVTRDLRRVLIPITEPAA